MPNKIFCEHCGRVFRVTANEVACPGCGSVFPPLSGGEFERDHDGREDWRDDDELDDDEH